MKKILILSTIGLNYVGITSVIKNYIAAMDTTGLEFCFVAFPEIPESLKKDFETYGSVCCITNRKKSFFSYLIDIIGLMRQGFHTVHIHGNSGTMLIEVLLARLCGIRNVIIHSHSTKTSFPLINRILKKPMMRLADLCIACSKASGDWLYGHYPHTILNNAIDLPKFAFCDDLRKKYRDEFHVGDIFLVGHIGHFTEQKNHFFLIDVFAAFHKLEPNSKLLLISDGPRFQQVQEKVAQLGLQDAVIFAGRRSDVAGIYSAMDLFILPSCWEGLPLVMVEAQMNGLPLLVSDAVTSSAKCTDRVWYKSLEDGAQSWAETLLKLKNQRFDRQKDFRGIIAEKGFDIQAEAEKLRQLYLKDY